MDKKQYLLPPSKGGMAPINSLTCNCTDFNHTNLPNDSGWLLVNQNQLNLMKQYDQQSHIQHHATYEYMDMCHFSIRPAFTNLQPVVIPPVPRKNSHNASNSSGDAAHGHDAGILRG